MLREKRARWAAASAMLATALLLPACDFNNPTSTPVPAATATQAAVAPTPTEQALPSPTQPEGPTPQIAGDGQVNVAKLFHDSRDPQYRSPGGSVVGGTDVTLRLKSAPGDLTGAEIRITNTSTQSETVVPMRPVAGANDIWEGIVHTPTEGGPLVYHFVGIDGQQQGYYQDDAGLDAMSGGKNPDGGVGEGTSYATNNDYTLTVYSAGFQTPSWVQDAVVYQIFPDRFDNGDPKNDKPAGTFFYGDTTTTHQWGDQPVQGGKDFFGGDLQGVIDKLDYLQSLGVTAIYFNPIFMSPSNHRYDTTDYTQIDPSLGDINTFKDLVSKAKAKGIHIILDGVFNHSSSDSVYFDKYSRYPTTGAFESKDSPYFSWYTFTNWPNKYRNWSGVTTLPQFTENDPVKDFLFRGADSVAQLWLKNGASGWRLDAAEQKSHTFWADFRQAVKQADPDALIVGEFWHNSAPWLSGDQWDGTMNYRFRDAVESWFTNPVRNAQTLSNQLDAIREDYPPQALAASMTLIDSHDTERALTTVNGDKNILKLMAVMQFTFPGMPTIYYGDEAGLEGGRDPDDRRTYPWGSEDKDLIAFYTMLGKLRHSMTALRTGDYITLAADPKQDIYSFARKDGSGAAVVALNRAKEAREIDLPMKGVASDGATFVDQLAPGTSYTVLGGTLKVKLGASWGVLLTSK